MILISSCNNKFSSFDIFTTDTILETPFNRKELIKAIKIAQDRILYRRKLIINKSMESILSQKIYFKSGKSTVIMGINDIFFVEKVDRKINIHTTNGIYDSYETLCNMQERLGNQFYMTHRSYICNIDKITRFVPVGDTYEVYFQGYDKQALVSRGKKDHIIQLVTMSVPIYLSKLYETKESRRFWTSNMKEKHSDR